MCRFVAYLGPDIVLDSLLTRPKNSLIHQSYHALERVEPLNGDGFGVAWYVPELSSEPGLFRSVSPAWNSQNLISMARVICSPCVLAHVRAASPGLAVTRTNCHPFVTGNLAWIHNGELAGFRRGRRDLLAGLSDEAFGSIGGTTDSEHLFAVFLDFYAKRADDTPCARLRAALGDTLVWADEFTRRYGDGGVSQLNLAVSDGHCLAASRYTTGPADKANSLYVHHGGRYDCSDGTCRMREARGDELAVIVSSEQLSEDPGWQRLPPQHLAAVGVDRGVAISPL